MTTSKKIVVGVVSLAVLVVGFILGSLGGQKAPAPAASPDAQLGGVVYDKSVLVGDVLQGPNGTLMMSGGKLIAPTISKAFATTSTGSGTLTSANIANVATILSTNAGALTLTLPASTTFTGANTFVPVAGDRRSFVIVNQGTTLLTMAGGTGTLLQTASSTKTVNIGGSAELICTRKTNTDIVCLLSAGI